MSAATRGLELRDDGGLDVLLGLLERVGGRLGPDGVEDHRPLVLAEVLQDVGELAGVQVADLRVLDLQPDRPSRLLRLAEGLDELPRDQLVGERPARHGPQAADDPLEAEPAQEPGEPDVHVDDPRAVGHEQLDVVHPLDLRPLHVDDLLVEQEVADQEVLWSEGEVAQARRIDPDGAPAGKRVQLRGRHRGDLPPPGLQIEHEPPHERIHLPGAGGEVDGLSDHAAVGAHDLPRQDLGDEDEGDGVVLLHRGPPGRQGFKTVFVRRLDVPARKIKARVSRTRSAYPRRVVHRVSACTTGGDAPRLRLPDRQ